MHSKRNSLHAARFADWGGQTLVVGPSVATDLWQRIEEAATYGARTSGFVWTTGGLLLSLGIHPSCFVGLL